MNRVAAGIARRFDDRVDGEIGRSALARQLTRLVACEHMARAGIVGGKDRDRDDVELRGRPRDAPEAISPRLAMSILRSDILSLQFFRSYGQKLWTDRHSVNIFTYSVEARHNSIATHESADEHKRCRD